MLLSLTTISSHVFPGRVTRLLAAYSTHSDPPILLDDDFDADYKFDVRAATEIGTTLESNQTGTEWFSARFGIIFCCNVFNGYHYLNHFCFCPIDTRAEFRYHVTNRK